ncbi:MAG: hypothetical protein WCQ47_07100, partial [bacterium]
LGANNLLGLGNKEKTAERYWLPTVEKYENKKGSFIIKDQNSCVGIPPKAELVMELESIPCEKFDSKDPKIVALLSNTYTHQSIKSFCNVEVVVIKAIKRTKDGANETCKISTNKGIQNTMFVYNDDYLAFVPITTYILDKKYSFSDDLPTKEKRYDGICEDPIVRKYSNLDINKVMVARSIIGFNPGYSKTIDAFQLVSKGDLSLGDNTIFPPSLQKLFSIKIYCPKMFGPTSADVDPYFSKFSYGFSQALAAISKDKPAGNVGDYLNSDKTTLGPVDTNFSNSKFNNVFLNVKNGTNQELPKAYADEIKAILGVSDGSKIEIGSLPFYNALAESAGFTSLVTPKVGDKWAIADYLNLPTIINNSSTQQSTTTTTTTTATAATTTTVTVTASPAKGSKLPSKLKKGAALNEPEMLKSNRIYNFFFPDAFSTPLTSQQVLPYYILNGTNSEYLQLGAASTASNYYVNGLNTLNYAVSNPGSVSSSSIAGTVNGVGSTTGSVPGTGSVSDGSTDGKHKGWLGKWLGSEGASQLGILGLSYLMTSEQQKIDTARIESQLQLELIKSRMNACSSLDCSLQQDLCLMQKVKCRTDMKILGIKVGRKDDMCMKKDLPATSDEAKGCYVCSASLTATQAYMNPYTGETKQMTTYEICLMNVTNAMLKSNKCFDLVQMNMKTPGLIADTDIKNCFLGITPTKNTTGINYIPGTTAASGTGNKSEEKKAEEKKKDAAATPAGSGSASAASPGSTLKEKETPKNFDMNVGRYNQKDEPSQRFPGSNYGYGSNAGSYNANTATTADTGSGLKTIKPTQEGMSIIEMLEAQRKAVSDKTH